MHKLSNKVRFGILGRKNQENLWLIAKLKAGAQEATQNESFDNCTEKLHNIRSKNSHKKLILLKGTLMQI